jgi:hypothetical protein
MSLHDDDAPPTDPALDAEVRAAAFARDRTRADAPASDVSAERLQDAVAGRLASEERQRVLDATRRTEQGRREVALLRTAHRAAGDAGPAGGRADAPWWTRPGLAAGAALVIAAGLGGGAWWQAWHASPNAVDAGTLRAAAVAADEIRLVRSDVTAGEGARLAWRAVPGAARYHVEVLAADGAAVHVMSTTDTTVTLPATVQPPSGTSYEWWVRARLADGGTRRSGAGRLLSAR